MQCLWIVYRAKCDVVDDMTEFRIADEGVDAEFRGEKIPYRIPDKTHRHVVVCQSRFFMYDKWQILFTILELYRFYGVDLIAVYVESIIAEAYNILKAYQERGFIAIHSAVKYENFEDLDYDPNRQTEWNQQISAYQLCLYEYRETTDFIIFGDWDEVLIPQNTTNLHEELKILLEEFPNAAAFYFQRMQVSSYIPKQASSFNMADLLNTTMAFDHFGATKVVVVGNRVESMGVHKIWGKKPRTREVNLTTEYSKFLHFRESGKRTCHDETCLLELFPTLNRTQLADNFTTFIDQEGLYSNFVKLPSDLVYSDSFRQCYINISTTLGHPEWGICPNNLFCSHPERAYAIPCVKLNIQFGRVVLREEVVVSYPKRTALYRNSDGC
ncbi:hypothetical protein L596_029757 [Steinernema carpocapsae]|uniref:Glycosyltransferase family 92 protein n=1 Tax=Steinernema carpocapsae TaxID=34508 RepID=A0A4V5ZX39_STECR|nr:hypothetical protein L596_029757 [Steinernema carpocapsae]